LSLRVVVLLLASDEGLWLLMVPVPMTDGTAQLDCWLWYFESFGRVVLDVPPASKNVAWHSPQRLQRR